MNLEAPHDGTSRYAYFECLVQSMDNGFCILEMVPDEQGRARDFRFVEVNPAFEVESGLAQPLGRSLRDLVPRITQEELDRIASVLNMSHPVYMRDEPGPSGRLFDAQLTRVGGPGSRFVGLLFRDVTERHRRIAALRRSEARYRRLFDSIDEGFCIVQLIRDEQGRAVDYRFLEVNPAATRHSGIDAVVGRTVRELQPDVEEDWFTVYGRVADTGEPMRFQQQARALGRWFDVYAFAADEPDCVAVLFSDITERIATQQELQDADRRKDEFLAMLAHELRNPLAPISAAADLLRRGPDDARRVAQASAIIQRQVGHMTGLVNDLLDVSRVTRGAVTLDRVHVDMKIVVGEAVEQVRPLIESRRHALDVRMTPQPAWVMGDPTRLVQVVANLLNNAARYTPEGGHIRVLLDAGQELEIHVRDTGIGMEPEFLPHAFALFAQAKRSSDRSQGGLGIGLALVRSLVELQGGSVGVRSEGPGKGSCFSVRLPLAAPPPRRDGAHRDADRVGGRKLSVLIVDDNEDAAITLGMLVDTMGHASAVEFSSRAALDALRHALPEVCLLDIGLPDMNGHDLARAIRAMPHGDAVMLVAVTGYGQEQDREQTTAAGFDAHFLKPVAPEALAALFAQVAARRVDMPA